MIEDAAAVDGVRRTVWIVEDDPAAAQLAAELCAASDAASEHFHESLSYLNALRSDDAPDVVVLDWRLEHDLSAALFLATRHRFPAMPVVYWTASALPALPAMIRDDPGTLVIDKAGGIAAFEHGLRWALERGAAVR